MPPPGTSWWTVTGMPECRPASRGFGGALGTRGGVFAVIVNEVAHALRRSSGRQEPSSLSEDRLILNGTIAEPMTSLPPAAHRPPPPVSGERIVPEDAFALIVESCSAPYGRSIIELRLDTQPRGWFRRWNRDAGRALPPTPEFLTQHLEESGVTGRLQVWCEAPGQTHTLGTMLVGVIRRELRLLLQGRMLGAAHDQL